MSDRVLASPCISARIAVIAGLLLTGCATLTPTQSAALTEAQRLADDVTAHYGVARVKVIADRDNVEGYWQRGDWITVHPDTLTKDHRLVVIASSLAPATLSYQRVTAYGTPIGLARLREQLLTFNRRGVDILVKFLHLTTRDAVDHYATAFVARSKTHVNPATLPRPTGLMLTHDRRYWSSVREFLAVPPCDQLHDLWTHFAITEPPPACGSSGAGD